LGPGKESGYCRTQPLSFWRRCFHARVHRDPSPDGVVDAFTSRKEAMRGVEAEGIVVPFGLTDCGLGIPPFLVRNADPLPNPIDADICRISDRNDRFSPASPTRNSSCPLQMAGARTPAPFMRFSITGPATDMKALRSRGRPPALTKNCRRDIPVDRFFVHRRPACCAHLKHPGFRMTFQPTGVSRWRCVIQWFDFAGFLVRRTARIYPPPAANHRGPIDLRLRGLAGNLCRTIPTVLWAALGTGPSRRFA